RVLAWLQVFHQEAVLIVAQQVAANGGCVEMRHVEINKGFVDFLRSGLVDAFGLGALEGFVDLALGQVQATNAAVSGQLTPAGRLVNVFPDGGGLLRNASSFLH